MPDAFAPAPGQQQPPVEPTEAVEPAEPQACSHCGRNDPRHLKYVAKYGVCTA